MSETVSEPFRVRWDGTVSLGQLLTIVSLLLAGIAGWGNLKAEVDKNKEQTANQQVVMDAWKPLIEKQTETLDLLQAQLRTFPLHKHVDHTIVYSDGSVSDMPH